MGLNVETATREELIAAYQASNKKIFQLEIQLSWFKRQVFGAKSERLIPQDPKQATLFDAPEEPPSPETTVKQYERKHRCQATDTETDNKLRFDESVPVEEAVVLPKEIQGLPEDEYDVIGEKVTNRLCQKPATYFIKRTIRKTVKLKEKQSIHTAPAPDAVIERSFADVSFLVGLLVDKFQYHLPLYRQHQRLKFSGVNVSRGHLTKLTHRTLELLEPIYYALLSEIVTSELVCMDETPIKAGRKSKGKMNAAYFWPVLAENQVAFYYSKTRAQTAVFEVLDNVPQEEDKCCKLLSDGYSAYDAYVKTRANLIHANCWAHARRKFFEALDYSKSECEHVLGLINELFAIESELKNKDPSEILIARRTKSLIIVDDYFRHLNKLYYEDFVEKDSPLGKAIAYSLNSELELRQFLMHADIPLSNNQVERSIRPVAIGRKNWMFCWSEVGAKYAAIAFSLIESCKLANVNPSEYLNDVLKRIDSHPARDIHLLTPKNWTLLVNNAS